MPAAKRTTKRKTAKRDAPPEGVLDAVAALSAQGARRFLRLVARHPALSTGIAAFGVIFTSVSVNALYEQHGRHPNPMLVTRQISAGTSAARPVRQASLTPSQRIEEASARPADEAAEPSAAGTARIPAPAPRPLERPDPEQTASIVTGGRVVAVPDETTDLPENGGERFASLSQSDRVKKIQAALASAQVAELSVDGILGEKTRAAIRTFEALEGMDVTGDPNEQVLERLAEIGLVQ